jgi:hypothetical protein
MNVIATTLTAASKNVMRFVMVYGFGTCRLSASVNCEFSNANAVAHNAVMITAAQATDRHRRDGRCPSGNRRKGKVRSAPKIGTQIQLLSHTAKVPAGPPGCTTVAQYAYVSSRENARATPTQTPR